jgi:hypothetical protein
MEKLDEVKAKVEKEVSEEVADLKAKGLVGWFKGLDSKEKFFALAGCLVVLVLVVAGISALV